MRSILRKEGTLVTLRSVTRSSGPDPAINPARLVWVVVEGNHAAGSTTLALRGTAIEGRFVLGDLIAVTNGPTPSVGAPVTASGNGVTLSLSSPLTMSVTGGTPVTIRWAADKLLHARIQPYQRNLVDGQMILTNDVSVRVAYLDVRVPPRPQDLLLLETSEGEGEQTLTVISCRALTENNVVLGYDIQARAT